MTTGSLPSTSATTAIYTVPGLDKGEGGEDQFDLDGMVMRLVRTAPVRQVRNEGWQDAEFVLHQLHMGGLRCGVAPHFAHRKPDDGLGWCLGIVHAAAEHPDHFFRAAAGGV